MFNYQKLQIYQLAKGIVKLNYQLTKTFPNEEKFALVQQMNRAAISIPSNITEGASRKSNKEKKHFINISYASLMELSCQMEISLDLGYIGQDDYDEFLQQSKNLSVKLYNFANTIA